MKPGKDSETVEAQAADWFARQRAGDWTDRDEAALEMWLQEATAHRVAFVRLNAGWERSSRLVALGAGVPPGEIPARGSWTFSPFFDQSDGTAGTTSSASDVPPRKSSRKPLLLAASFLFALVGAGAWKYFAAVGDVYQTRIGHSDTIPLRDGTRVTLNTDSKIRVELNEKERRVELDRGEAFFDVAKDARWPFTVLAARKRIVAVGTKFSVRRVRDDIVVVVTEGRVRIDDPETSDAPPTQLVAGAVAQTRQTAIRVRQHPLPEAEQLLSWRNGYVTFRDTDLADAVSEFNRYSKKKIRIQDEVLEHIRIGGNFRTDDAEPFLWLLENGFPVRVRQESDEVVLTHR